MTRFLHPVLFCLIVMVFTPFAELKAQEGKFSADISHPVVVGETFFSQYNGVIGIDLGYTYPLSKRFSVEAKAGYTFSKYTFYTTIDQPRSTTRGHIFEVLAGPSLHLEMARDMLFSPFVKVGYANVRFRNKDFDDTSISNGLNTEIGVSFDFIGWEKTAAGLFTSYQFIYREKPEVGENSGYNREMHFVNFGFKVMHSF